MAALGIGLLIAAHLADYVTFLVMVMRNGIGAELNPVVVRIATEGGLAPLTMAKFSTVLFLAATFIIVSRTRPRLAAGVLAFGILGGAFGAFSNIISW
jgi:hypothetical protein